MVQRVISLNQNEWLKTYIEMNNKLRAEVKMILRTTFSN